MDASFQRRVSWLVACAAAALVVALPAHGAPGVNLVEATCAPNQIIVTAPTMQPSYHQYPNAGGLLWTYTTQWVAYRAHLARHDGTRWVHEQSGLWFAKLVRNDSAVWEGENWFAYENNAWRPVQGSTYFTPRPGAYYAVSAEYYWYPMPHLNIGADYLHPTWASNHFEQRSGGPYTAGRMESCWY